MKRIVTILTALILTGIPFYVCHAKFGIGIPSVVKERVEDLDKKVEEKKKAEGNHSPNTPAAPTPANGATGCPVTQDISWSGGDPNIGDSVVYDVFFGVSIPPSLVSDDQTGTSYDPGTLNNNKVYYWKIVAKDSHGASAIGEVWSFSTIPGTTIKSWQTAGFIEIDNAGNAYDPQVAIDPNGNAIAVWEHFDGTRYNIQANRYVAGVGWQTAGLIETDDTGHARDPQVAIDSNGNAFAVWEHFDGTRYNIQANRYVAGVGWQTAGLIETDDTGHATDPQVAIDSNGNAIAVWEHYDGTVYNIQANRYVAGVGWQTAGLIETDDTGGAYDPQVAIDPNGNALAVWEHFDGTRYNIQANRYESGSWQTAGLIETDDAGSAYDPQVAIDSNGNALAVWEHYDGTWYNIQANRYVAGVGWQTAGLIETDDAGSARDPQVAIDSNGNALAVWEHHDGTVYNIQANRYESGSWQTAGLIETDDTGSARDPQVAIDSNGNALAVWEHYDGTVYNIQANRYVAGVGWQTAGLIETDDAGSATDPQVATDLNGNALAVWEHDDGTRYNIGANRYE